MMALIWKPSTCQCELEFSQWPNEQANFLQAISKCKLHTAIPDNVLVDTVIAHNQTFHLAFGRTPTDIQKDLIKANVEAEKDRISKL